MKEAPPSFAASAESIPPTAATASSITTAAATASAIAAASTAAAAFLTGPGLIDGQPSAVLLLVVKPLDGGFCLGLCVHLDEPEAFAPTGFPVLDDLSGLDEAELGEHLLQVGVGDSVRQVSNIQLFTHD
jgi:hypothetical protein